MGPDVIVFLEPCVDHNLCLFDAMEPLGIQGFIAKNAVEAMPPEPDGFITYIYAITISRS